jgi:hypothetical protein
VSPPLPTLLISFFVEIPKKVSAILKIKYEGKNRGIGGDVEKELDWEVDKA